MPQSPPGFASHMARTTESAKRDFVEAPTDISLPVIRSAPKPDGGLGRQWGRKETHALQQKPERGPFRLLAKLM
jgi:hypothetical protein